MLRIVMISFAELGRAHYVNQKLSVRKFFGVTFFSKKVTKNLTQANIQKSDIKTLKNPPFEFL